MGYQVRTVTRFATPDTDDDLAADAPSSSVTELNRRARQVNLDDVQQVRCDRSFDKAFDEEHPVLWLSGRMGDVDGVEFVKTITRLASQMSAQPGGTYEPFEARCLDALIMLASQHRGCRQRP
jgi:hypothetical protein